MKILIRALLACLLPVLVLLLMAPAKSGIIGTYSKLSNWDSMHYAQIAQEGYLLPSGEVTSDDIHERRANVVFFPAYPLVGRWTAALTGLPILAALPLAAQLACVIFWIYLFSLLQRRNVSQQQISYTALLILVHPAAFFLVCGYTESLFLAAMMGFIYWSDRWVEQERGVGAWLMASLHGMVMSATRIVAFAVAGYPFLRVLAKGVRKSAIAVVLGMMTLLGAVAFFAYCQLHFGDWSVYFKLEEIGWKNQKMWFAIFNPLSYVPRFFFEHEIESLNRSAVLFTAIQLVLGFLLAKRWKWFSTWIVAFLLFYIPLTGKANANMDSMLRYTFPVYILLLVDSASHGGKPWIKKPWLRHACITLVLVIQLICAWRFLRGSWIA